jgi:hypothetical protein
MRSTLLIGLALTGAAQAQITLPTNLLPNNGGSPNWGLFFDFTAGASTLTVTHLRTASNAAAASPIAFDVLTYVGSGLGGPLASGPGSSPVGWTTVGSANGFQGPTANGISDVVDIPDVVVPAGQTVGVCLLFTTAGPRYFGTGTPPYQVIADANLTLTTGDSRSVPFTTTGTFFTSRSLCGEVTYVLGGAGGVGTNYCGPGVVNSTGNPGTIRATGSAVVANNDLTLVADDLPTNAFGYFLTSMTQGLVPQPGGSLGVLCLGGNIGRYTGPGQIQNSGMTGSFDLLLDLTQTPTPTGFVSVAAGETWNFQAWHRDSVGGAAVSNFTDGLEVDFN